MKQPDIDAELAEIGERMKNDVMPTGLTEGEQLEWLQKEIERRQAALKTCSTPEPNSQHLGVYF